MSASSLLLYATNPLSFANDVLGQDKIWSKQAEVMEAVRDHPRVAVRSGHSTGKSFVAAAVSLWWLFARQGLVVTTARTDRQVRDVLWRQIHEMGSRAKVPLPGWPGDWALTEIRLSKELYAVGLTAEKGAFQGRHHPRLLVIVDEAAEVNEDAHLEISTLATGDQNRILMIGNPTITSGTFYEAFKAPDLWRCIRISCLEHPNVVEGREVIPGAVTRGWIEGRRRAWGEHHPFWFSRVLGEFPKISTRGVIPLGWVERSMNEEKRLEALAQAEKERIPRVAGLDVARYGDNRCVLIVRRGDAVESIESWGHLSLTETTGRAMRAISDLQLKTLVVDAAGIGAGVVDRLLELNAPVYAYNGGHRAFTPSTYANRRSEMWWHLRQRLERERLWLPSTAEGTEELGVGRLVGDLVTPEYALSSAGRVTVETKEKLLERGVRSPDFADSLCLAFSTDEDPEAILQEPPKDRQDRVAYAALQPLDHAPVPFPALPSGF